jgi:biopolymer transport protein ExbD
MPKIKMPRSAPSIDMTPMVDLAFLLVTFFMLNANFRANEPVEISTPSSISDKEVPLKSLVMVTVDKEGYIYFNASGEKTREIMLGEMSKKYNVTFTPEQKEEFIAMSSFGCDVRQLPKYLELTVEERKRLKSGIPADSTNNQLRDWIYYGRLASLQTGEKQYIEEQDKTKDKLDVNDFKPKFVLKVDGKAAYAYAKRVIEVFRDLNINNLHFVTSLEQNPNQRQSE